MKFLILDPQKDQNFSLVYRAEDYSFDVEPLNGTGDTSIMINDLQLEIDHDGKIMYVWGLCPLIKYVEINEFPIKYKIGSLIALLDKPPVPGISYRLNEERWMVYVNKKKRWICLGNPEITDKQLVEFAPGCIAAMNGQELVAIWLHPEKFPDLTN